MKELLKQQGDSKGSKAPKFNENYSVDTHQGNKKANEDVERVESTNNRSERNIRREAEVRKGGRTSKTPQGAKRRGIIMTVLATLNTRFEHFTLSLLLTEINRWIEAGQSLFQSELDNIYQAQAPPIA